MTNDQASMTKEAPTPIVVKPLEFRECANGFRAVRGWFEIYKCSDDTWRVFFEHGYDTSEGDQKVRKLPSREAAEQKANELWVEWLMQWVDVSPLQQRIAVLETQLEQNKDSRIEWLRERHGG